VRRRGNSWEIERRQLDTLGGLTIRDLCRIESAQFQINSEETMAQISLTRMNVDQLTDLRTKVDARLLEHRGQIEKQLDRLAKIGVEHSTFREGRRGGVLRRGSVLKGVKVAPKYKGPGGETWAGRGARPRWLAAAMKGGKKLENFLIGKSGVKARKQSKG
jgi:DNA-binding protein H-NS